MPKSMSAVIWMSPLAAVLISAESTVAPVAYVPPPAVTRPFVGLAFVGAAVCNLTTQSDRPIRSASSFSSVVNSGIVSLYLHPNAI